MLLVAVTVGRDSIALLLEVHLTVVFILGVHHHGVVEVVVGTAHEGDAELIPVVGGLHRKRQVVGCSQSVVEHIGIVARQCSVVVTVRGHHVDVLLLRVFGCHSGHGTQGQRAVGVLNELVAHQRTAPVRLVAVAGSYADVLLVQVSARTEGTPAPDVAFGAVGGCFAGIECTAVEHSLMTVGRPLRTIVEAVLQLVVGAGHHVLHLTAPRGTEALAIHQIPPVAHLEDVGALEHAVPDHADASYVFPRLQVGRLELGKHWVAATNGVGGNEHVVEVVIGHKDLRVAEIVAGVAEVRAVERPELVLGPRLEVGRCGTHHHLAVFAVSVVAGVIDVVRAVLLVGTSRTDGCVLLVVVGSVGNDFAQRCVVGSVLG